MVNEVATLGLDDEEVEDEKEEVSNSSLVYSQQTGSGETNISVLEWDDGFNEPENWIFPPYCPTQKEGK